MKRVGKWWKGKGAVQSIFVDVIGVLDVLELAAYVIAGVCWVGHFVIHRGWLHF